MEKLLHMEYRGIKCDNPNCGWADWSVTQDQYDDYVDKPCPVCGENLLTKECHEKTKAVLAVAKRLNMLLNEILPDDVKKYAAEHVDESIVTYGVNADGSFNGKVMGPFPNPERKRKTEEV